MRLDRQEVMRRIEQSGLVAVIRADDADQAVDICRALRDGGVIAHEIAMTTPGALRAIERASAELGDECLVEWGEHDVAHPGCHLPEDGAAVLEEHLRGEEHRDPGADAALLPQDLVSRG